MNKYLKITRLTVLGRLFGKHKRTSMREIKRGLGESQINAVIVLLHITLLVVSRR
ncbi:MAG: hypothetical protein ISR78_00255 [Spirochaetia bacterium]|nr:hypothetical protein [Spirochaetia bacterium]